MAAMQAMQFAKVTADKISYIELRCGETHAQIPSDESMYMTVDDEPFVCLSMKSTAMQAFIVNSTELRDSTKSDRLADFKGMCELRELRNSWEADDGHEHKSLFCNPVKNSSPRSNVL